MQDSIRQDSGSSTQRLPSELLSRWARWAERYWYDLPGHAGLGCFGSGYNAWGVQTNQKYVGAMAVLATAPVQYGGFSRDQALERALAGLRFSLASHVSGPLVCTDGTQWGHTWISGLGIERMMYGIYRLEHELSEGDRVAVRRVLSSEADWLLEYYHKGEHFGIFGDPWNASGCNVPESNLWNGCLLWRTAAAYPDHPHVSDWQERAHRFLLNAVSVATDVGDMTMVAGKSVQDRFAGANFFPNFALDHHGYLNVGYMGICLSNAAILHFDIRTRNWPRPESLDRHERDLWAVVKRMLFADGRLAQIGGDTRLRYTYCQDYLVSALLYAADRMGDPHALTLLGRQFEWMSLEAGYNGDGSFFSRRLEHIRCANPYYYTRLESDRACVLAMATAWMPEASGQKAPFSGSTTLPPSLEWEGAGRAGVSFEESVRGAWCEPEHGAVLHRCPTRLASFAWRAHGLAQGICLSPGNGHDAEWMHNLGGCVRGQGDTGIIEDGQDRHRELRGYTIQEFDGGFLTYGSVREGCNLTIPEGWRGSMGLIHQIVFAALPDGHTVVGIQHCRAGAIRAYVTEAKGLLLNLPNDLFTGFERRVSVEGGTVILTRPVAHDETLGLGSRWACVDDRIGVLGLYGAGELTVSRSMARRGGKYASLHVEELCFPCLMGPQSFSPGEVIFDVGWAVLASAGCDDVRAMVRDSAVVAGLPDDVRAVQVTGRDARVYTVCANFGERSVSMEGTLLGGDDARMTLEPGEAKWIFSTDCCGA